MHDLQEQIKGFQHIFHTVYILRCVLVVLKISHAFQNVICTQKGILLSLQKEGPMTGEEGRLLVFSYTLVTTHGKHMAS